MVLSCYGTHVAHASQLRMEKGVQSGFPHWHSVRMECDWLLGQATRRSGFGMAEVERQSVLLNTLSPIALRRLHFRLVCWLLQRTRLLHFGILKHFVLFTHSTEAAMRWRSRLTVP